jgi:hypothetical protein
MNMKTLLLLVAFACITAVSAQTTQKPLTAEDYMKKVPAIPGNVCLCDPSARDAFQSAVSELKQVIRDDADERERKMNEYMESQEDAIKERMVKMSGMSDADVKRLKSGKEMSESEKMAMADKMMQQRTNISMEEMKKLSKMSKAGQEAWAQGYAAEQQAMAQTGNQQKNPMADMAASMNSQVAEQNEATSKIQGLQTDLKQKFDSLNASAQADKMLLENELQPFYKIMASHNGEGATQKDVEDDQKARAQVKLRQEKFCQKWTPRMLEFLKECKLAIGNALPDYDHLDELKYQSMENQAGKKLDRKITGIESITAVAFYLGFAEETFNFRLD